jgi:tRNA G18 (ribose-2'-O)-methylase SpoU
VPERVADPRDPRLRDFTDLRDTQLRTAKEAAEGLFLAEGDTTIRRALAAGYRPRALLATDRWAGRYADLDAPVYVGDDDVVHGVTGFAVHRGALASFDRKPLPEAGDLLGEATRIVVVEDLVDPTNVGLIFRSVAALGWDGVLLTPRCADPLFRRAVKTSMGAVFAVPWTRVPWFEGAALLRAAGFTLAALTPSAEAVPLDEVPRETPRLALAVGTEGPGLSRRWLDTADLLVRIPMAEGVDSLNVAAAAAIALYALRPGGGRD